jgi:nitroimidazol reductase NimA-like FMN-containing flavoprotein (pyridoxamine 5'-phosphate oxidase superfamily)
MSQNSPLSRSYVTRQDRAVNDEAWIAAFLMQAPIATIGTIHDEQPYLSTLLFAFDEPERAIYFHTARRGRVWENLQQNPHTCLTVTEMGRLLPAEAAFGFSVEYQSVVVFGDTHPLGDPSEARRALQMMLDKYFSRLQSGRDYQTMTGDEIAATAVYRLEIQEWSGKRKTVPADFPGAFHWGEQ